jgi:N-acetylmuramoyl-L-alanine amidase
MGNLQAPAVQWMCANSYIDSFFLHLLRTVSRIPCLISLLLFALIVLPAHPQAPSSPPARFVVLLDAAHGGDDAGSSLMAQSGQAQVEKTYTLALSVRLRSLLGARGITVVTSRESDTNLGAQQRGEIADHAQAQACLTLHASASGTGVHLFLSSLPPAQPARFMPWKTAQAAYIDRSIALAGVLNSALAHAGMKVTLGRTALTSIDSMTCPAIAIEVAPEPNPGGGLIDVGDPAYQARIATAIAAGMLQWRAEPRQP